ncbi:MAG: hypothetical protein ACRCTI_13090 [Beijerinckiaceae bacterium]
MSKSLIFAAVAASALIGPTGLSAASDKVPPQADRTITYSIPQHVLKDFVGSLGPDFDFTVFVDPDCPVDLHRMGLRRLWTVMAAEAAKPR